MKQKGMEMPIQIFITLFVLLAVAILVLTLVQQQFSQSTGELDKQKREQEFQQSISLARSACQNSCRQACESAQRKTSYCISTVPTLPLNLSKDENTYDETYLAGVGVCEDQIYCAQVFDCDCGGSVLTMTSCKTEMCNYWKSPSGGGLTDAQADARLGNFMKPGICPDSTNPSHWYRSQPYNGVTDCP